MRLPSASWKETVPQAASRQEASARPSSPGLSGTMTPSRETEAVVASCGMPSASRMLPSVSGPRLSQHSCMLRVRRCRVLTDGVMAPVFAKNAAASRAVQ